MSIEIRKGNGQKVVFDDPNDYPKMELKAERNAILAETDCMMVSDRGLTDAKKAEWVTYRQALRDMDFSDLKNINWPKEPT